MLDTEVGSRSRPGGGEVGALVQVLLYLFIFFKVFYEFFKRASLLSLLALEREIGVWRACTM